MKRRGLIFLTVIGLVFVSGCLSDLDELNSIEEFEWNPELALPLINSEFAFEDFIDEVDSSSLIEVSEDGLISLLYESALTTQTAEDLYTIPNQDFAADVTIPDLGDLPLQGTIQYEETYNITFDAGGSALDSLVMKAGDLETIFRTDLAVDGNITLTIPSVTTASGEIYQQVFQWTAAEAPYESITNLDLNGVKLDLTEGGTNQNSFTFIIQAELTYTGTPITSSNMSVSMELAGPKFATLYGSIASLPLSTDPDTLEVTFFQNVEAGLFGLEEPQIDFFVNNSFGVPIEADFSKIKARKGFSQELSLSGPITESPVDIAFPSILEIGQSKVTDVYIGPDNSNLPDMINLLPDQFIYQFAGTVNPDNLSLLFIQDTSKVDIDYRFRLPLYGWVDGLELTNDFSFDGTILDNIDKAAFQIRTENQMPIGLELQLYFLDNFNNTLDSLILEDRQVINPAQVDSEGRSISTESAVNVYELDETRTNNIRNAQNLRVWIRTSTTNSESQQSVQIVSTDRIEVAIGLQVKPDITQ